MRARRLPQRGHEAQQPRVVGDERVQRRPRPRDARGRRRRVGVLVDARGLELRAQVRGGCIVRVDEEHRHHVVRVLVHPGLDFREPALEGAGVEQVAARVAEVPFVGAGRGVVCLVDLGREEAHAGVELDRGVVVLVA